MNCGLHLEEHVKPKCVTNIQRIIQIRWKMTCHIAYTLAQNIKMYTGVTHTHTLFSHTHTLPHMHAYTLLTTYKCDNCEPHQCTTCRETFKRLLLLLKMIFPAIMRENKTKRTTTKRTRTTLPSLFHYVKPSFSKPNSLIPLFPLLLWTWFKVRSPFSSIILLNFKSIF